MTPNFRAGLLGGKFVLIEQLDDHALRLRQNGKALAELFPQPFFAEDLLRRERVALSALFIRRREIFIEMLMIQNGF